MGEIGCFWAVKETDLYAVLERPERMPQFWGGPTVRPPSLLARWFGLKQQSAPAEPPWSPLEEPVEFDVDKAWHGIHFLLTGSDWKGSGPLAFILVGGKEIPEGLGHGPARCFTAEEVRQIDSVLKDIDPAALYEKADPTEFSRMNIYPDIWDSEPKEECVGYVTSYLADLQKFISETAQADRALIVYVS